MVKQGDGVGGREDWVVLTGHRELLDGKLKDAVDDFLERSFPKYWKAIHLIQNIYNPLLMFQEKKTFLRQSEGIFDPRCL